MNHTVSAAQVHELAGGILQRCLMIADHGHKCTVGNLLLVLFFAAARTGSIFDACRRLANGPSDQAVRNALVGQLPKDVKELERRLNLALRDKLPKSLFGKRRPMAIDLSEICYYGQPHRQQRELRRGKRKAGTTRFHCYATLYVVRRGERFTVAMSYVWKDDSHLSVIQRLLEQARSIGLVPRYLLLDRGFYGLEVVQYLKGVRCPFLMPVVHRGRRSKRPLSQLKGTRRFLAWKKSGFATHQMKNRRQQTNVKIAVRQRPLRQRRGRRGERLLPMVFCFWGFTPGSPAQAAEMYRKRYGIETSYRQMNQGRIRTCTRNPILRLLLVGIALVLRNLWVWLHRMILGHPRGSGIELHLELLRFRTLLLMLQRCAEQCLGCTETLHPPAAIASAAPMRSNWNY
jgi:putative transposase